MISRHRCFKFSAPSGRPVPPRHNAYRRTILVRYWSYNATTTRGNDDAMRALGVRLGRSETVAKRRKTVGKTARLAAVTDTGTPRIIRPVGPDGERPNGRGPRRRERNGTRAFFHGTQLQGWPNFFRQRSAF